MPLGPGSKLGPYVIVSPLGSGGMEYVYRARDVRLGRDVALKVLPEALVNSADRRDASGKKLAPLLSPPPK